MTFLRLNDRSSNPIYIMITKTKWGVGGVHKVVYLYFVKMPSFKVLTNSFHCIYSADKINYIDLNT